MARELSIAEVATMKLLEIKADEALRLTKKVKLSGNIYFANFGAGGLKEDTRKLLKTWEDMEMLKEVLSKSGITVGINEDFTVEYRY